MANSAKSKILVVLRVLFGLAFLAAAVMKLTSQPQMVAQFEIIGLGQWFRFATGAIEVIGVLLLIRASTVTIGAALLTCVSVGAFFAQLLRLHGDVIHCIVFAVVMGWIAWSYRGSLRAA